MQDSGHQLDTVDHPRTRAAVIAGRVDYIDLIAHECWHLLQLRDGTQDFDFLERTIDAEAARHDDGDFGLRGRYFIPGRAARRLAGDAEHIDATRQSNDLRHPVPGDPGRVQPLEAEHARPGRAGHGSLDGCNAGG